jgi:hypothetical protein
MYVDQVLDGQGQVDVLGAAAFGLVAHPSLNGPAGAITASHLGESGEWALSDCPVALIAPVAVGEPGHCASLRPEHAQSKLVLEWIYAKILSVYLNSDRTPHSWDCLRGEDDLDRLGAARWQGNRVPERLGTSDNRQTPRIHSARELAPEVGSSDDAA